MKPFSILFLMLASLPLAGLAQDDELGGRRDERIEAYRIAFLTRRMALTAQESQSFWPVYNQYQGELEKVRQEARGKNQAIRQSMLSGSDGEVEKLLDELVALRRKEYEVSQKFHGEFKRVLPIRKVAILYQAEQEFRKELIQAIQERRQEQRPAAAPIRRN